MRASMRPANVDEYINAAPENAREKLREIRSILKKAAPGAKEMLKWGMPVMIEKRILFSYAAFKSHLNFMPTGPAMEPFRKELADYPTGKDTIRFTYDRPLPEELIYRIAVYRLRDVLDHDAKWMYKNQNH
jgi:uncharacterized protein YdhG (YjbR/CyaY superfamily)